MSDIESLKAAIAETNDALSQKVKLLENNVKETATSIRDSVEQGAANVRSVANALSPAHQLKEHPYLVTGALLGVGVYLGTRSARKRAAERIVIHAAAPKDTGAPATGGFVTTEESASTEDTDDRSETATPSKIRAVAEPVVLGIFAAIAGEVVKRYFPKVEAQASAIQSAFIAEMTGRVVQEFK